MEEWVEHIEESILHSVYSGVGEDAYDPKLMLKMVCYEHLRGRTSPANWFADLTDDLSGALLWLGRGIKPSRNTCYNFRNRIGRVIAQINDDLVKHAVASGLVNCEEAAQDGTSISSHGSRNQAFNLSKLVKRKGELESFIAGDVQPEEAPKWTPKTDRGCNALLRRMETGLEVLRQRLTENAKKPKDKRKKEKHVVVSLTDPHAPFGKDKTKTFRFLYNLQTVTCTSTNFILSYEVSQINRDAGTLGPMIDRTQHNLGGRLKRMLVDSGYTGLHDLLNAEQRGVEILGPVGANSFTAQKKAQSGPLPQIPKSEFEWLPEEETYRCPEGHKLVPRGRATVTRATGVVKATRYGCPPEHCLACPRKSKCAKNPSTGRTIKRRDREEVVEAQIKKMESKEVQAIYKKRPQVIERTFADLKQHRNLNRLNGRGINKAKAEVGLAVLVQNLLHLERLRREHLNPLISK